MSNPFQDPETGEIKFPLRPLKDIVFIWPDAMPEKVGSFYIPSNIREKYKDSTGTILRTGKGCYSPKYKQFVPVKVKPGERVLYDYQMPFSMEVKGIDGLEYTVLYMGYLDLQGIIRDIV